MGFKDRKLINGAYSSSAQKVFPLSERGINGSISIAPNEAASDAFGRLRVSMPQTIFDSKQLYDSQPLFWDDQEVAGTGTSTLHRPDRASTTISVSDSTIGTRARQTFQRFNYQPGKSQLINMTFVLGEPDNGVTKRVGLFDDDNGLFLEQVGNEHNVVIRSSVSGAVTEDRVEQASWNIDKLDGTGPSEEVIDFTKAQILFMDYEWLGVGRARFGFVIGGQLFAVHEFKHANVKAAVYMSTPNLPLRYEISNDGTGVVSSLEHICTSVISEGGQEATGVLRHEDSDALSGLDTTNTYMLLALRLKSTHLDASVILEGLSVLAETANDTGHWEVIINPTIAGAVSWVDVPNSSVQVAKGVSTNIISNGIETDGGYFSTSIPATSTTPNALRVGAAIDGTPDVIALCVRPITNNITIEGSLTWRELS